jgi:hypothetical protein
MTKAKNDLQQRHRMIVTLYSGVVVKALKDFGERLEAGGPLASDGIVTLSELNGAIKTLGAEVRALGGRTRGNVTTEVPEGEPFEAPSKLKLYKPTRKLTG